MKKVSAELRRSTQDARRPHTMVTPNAQMTRMEIKRFLLLAIVRKVSFENARAMIGYHSISAIGVGCAFVSMLVTCPLFMRITRSAIGARAALWVITSAVMCEERQVSCNS